MSTRYAIRFFSGTPSSVEAEFEFGLSEVCLVLFSWSSNLRMKNGERKERAIVYREIFLFSSLSEKLDILGILLLTEAFIPMQQLCKFVNSSWKERKKNQSI